MNAAFERRANRAWIILAGLTLVSMAASCSGLTGLAVNGAVLAVATIKARYLLWDFLDVRSAPSGWRAAFLAWLLVIATTAWAASAISLLFPI
jgi:hypothetical protein